MSGAPFLVLGATGKTGRRVARRLAEGGWAVRAASRSGEQRFDWWDEETWAAAVDGVESVYVVDEQGPQAASLLADFTRLAVGRGVRRFVLLSARTLEQWTHDTSMFGAERAVRESGVGWTILRPCWFAQNFTEEPLFSDDVSRGRLVLPDWAGPEPFVDADDIADVAVAALTQDGHEGEVYSLSGPRLMTFGDCVREIEQASGRTIEQVPATREEYTAHLVRRGYAPDFADFVYEILDTIREGRTAYLSDGVQRALGREPRDFSRYVAQTVWSAPAGSAGVTGRPVDAR
ncbi:NAD(P)H-binding protein [Streptomyces sp. TRM70308]|uniref:NAD(P)H-binding protein n=1 Tax=Streptomyces sp. TRM70308 TaxID=3131932 RepID=UPI003CFC0642